VYAYITFIKNSSIGVVLISDNSNAFRELKACGEGIEDRLKDLVP